MDTSALASDEVARNRVTLAGIRRVIESIGWGCRSRDRVLIATYYGLLVGSKVFRGTQAIGVGMFPEFWLGSVAIDTPIGQFDCRARTTDFDIVNPNHEVELVRRIARRLSRVSNG